MPDYPKFEGWPDGENNILDGDDLPLTALRRSVNYDITDTGDLQRRKGRTKIYTGTPFPGTLYSNGKRILFIESGSLWELVYSLGAWSKALVRLNVGAHRAAYISVNNDIYWTNGITNGLLTQEGEDLPWGIDGPASQPNVLSAASGGSLEAGRYQVAITFVSDRGEESGTIQAVYVDVLAGGSIEIRDLPTPVDGSTINIYASTAGGEELYKIGSARPGAPSYRITAVSNVHGRILQTQYRIKPPVGDVLAYHNGRIYIADGRVVFYTEPLRYGLVHAISGFMTFPEDVTVMMGVRDGLYVCSDQTYWISGMDTEELQQLTILPYGAVWGTGIRLPKSENVAWFSEFGIVVAGTDGQATNVQEGKSAVGKFQSGAMIFREQDGLRQMIATLGSGTQSAYLAPDYVTLENARRGSAI